MGQLHQTSMFTQEQQGQSQIMTKIWTTLSEQDAEQQYKTISRLMKEQKECEIQVKWVHKQFISTNFTWKVVAGFQYPQLSLRQDIIHRKKSRQYYSIAEIEYILNLVAFFLHEFQQSVCIHSDIFAYMFINNNRIKACNPLFLYSKCSLNNCSKIYKNNVVNQIYQFLLLQKVSKVGKRQLDQVDHHYQTFWLTNLLQELTEQTNFDDFLQKKISSNRFIKKREEFHEFQQTPKFIVSDNKQDQQLKLEAKYEISRQLDFSPIISKLNYLSDYDQNLVESIDQDNGQFQQSRSRQTKSFDLQEYLQNQKHNDDIIFERNTPYQNNMIPQTQDENNSFSGSQNALSSYQYVVQEDQNGRYEGSKRNGKKEGQGTFYYVGGGFYAGEWKDDEMNGLGQLYYSQDNLAYRGNWKNGKFDGKGYIRNRDMEPIEGKFDYNDFSNVGRKWKQYEGIFKQDKRIGEGVLVLSNNETFKCTWKQDRPEEAVADGRGEFTTIQGDIIKGLWMQNQLQQLIRNPSQLSINSQSQLSVNSQG